MSEEDYKIEIMAGVPGHWDRIESHAMSPGIPDLGFCVEGYEGLIETKYAKTLNGKPEIRPTQVRWFRNRVKQHGNCWLSLKVEDYGYFLFHGTVVRDLAEAKSLRDWIVYASYFWDSEVMNWDDFKKVIMYGSEEIYANVTLPPPKAS